ncbi:hypothetical protein V8G54_027238 [Vigna mungo]|uniref:Uncharacterized protein n=1 Tax=Vigna mungo TaxID=3915 RepID=A0AAQ3N1I3_VIGMU
MLGNCTIFLCEHVFINPSNRSLLCRCETVLEPGFNSTVRIEKNRSKVRHKNKKSGSITQNNVVYKCHFCLHQNLKRGTPKGHIKGIYPSKDKSRSETIPPSKFITSETSELEKDTVSNGEINEINVFPSSTNTVSLTEGRKRKQDSFLSKNAIKTTNMSSKEVAKSAGSSSKRRRKSWTSLKEIAQKNDQNSQIANFTIPFILK